MGAFEKPSTFISIVVLFAIVVVSLINFGISLNNNNDITLDNESKEYLTKTTQTFEKSGFYNLTEDNEYPDDSIIGTENDTKVPIITDTLGNVKYSEGLSIKFLNTLFIIYDLPSMAIELLGLDLNWFRYVINTLFVGIYVYAVIMIKKFLFGS